MDIIGNRAPADGPHDRDLPRDRDAEADLDTAADLDLDAAPDPTAGTDRGRPLSDPASAESLAVGALVPGTGTLVGGSWMQFLSSGSYDGTPSGPQDQLRQGALVHGLPAALTLILGLGALLRRRADGPGRVRGLAGGAVPTGVVPVTIAPVFLRPAAGAPTVEDGVGG